MTAFQALNRDPVRLAVFYAALNLPNAFALTFWVVFLQSRGLALSEIGLLNGLGLFMNTLAAPIFGYIADKYWGLRRALITLSAANAAAIGLFWFAYGFSALLLCALLASAVSAAIFPIIEAITLRHQSAGRLTYGRIRLWGSLTFVVLTPLAGFVFAAAGVNGIFFAILAGATAIAIAALWQRPAPLAAHESRERPSIGELRGIVLQPRIGLALLSAAAINAAHAMIYGFGTVHWRASGIDERLIGLLWGTGTFAEVLLFAFVGRHLARWPALLFVATGGAAAVLRWLIMCLDPALPLLWVTQALHGLSYGATHIGLITFITRSVPERYAGSIQGSYNALAGGIIMGLAMIISGPLYATFGARAFLAMAAIAACGLAGALIAERLARLHRLAKV